MAVGLGHKAFLGFGEETTYGTLVARSKFLEINSGADSLKVVENRIHSGSVYRINQTLNQMVKAGILVQGDVGFDLRFEGAELLFKHALGSVTTDQPDAVNDPNTYRHIFKITDTLPTGLSFEIYRDITAFLVEGGKINNLALALSLDGFLVCTISIIGEDMSTGTKSTESLPTADLVNYTHGVVKWNAVEVAVKDFNITLNNNLSALYKLGSRYTREPFRAGKIEVTGTFTAEFDSTTLYDDFRSATNRALQLICEGNTIDTNYKYTVQVDVPIAVLTDAVPVVSDEGIITSTCDFRGYFSGSDKEMKVTLINTTTSV